VIDLMFAAALSGMRAAEAADNAEPGPVHARISRTVPGGERMKVTNEWLPPSFMFEEERDCPIFFQTELSGFGTVRVGSLCNKHPEE
jgi:hypothetical protein